MSRTLRSISFRTAARRSRSISSSSPPAVGPTARPSRPRTSGIRWRPPELGTGTLRRLLELARRDRRADDDAGRLAGSSQPRIDERKPRGERHLGAADAAIVIELRLLRNPADRTAVENHAT